MATMIQTTAPAAARAAFPGVEVAGVSWPLYKLYAVGVAVVVALVSLVMFTSHEVTAWSSALALLVTWWVARFRATTQSRSAESARNPE